jgi:hypothetical protein
MDAGYRNERTLGYEQLTSLAAATGLTVPSGTVRAVVIPTAQAVRWRDDGVNPTASVGMPLAAGVERSFDTANLAPLRFIEQAAGAVLNVTYYGLP